LITDVEKLGEANPLHPDRDVQGDDIYTLIYTSGTTGNPKGVVVPHATFVAEIAAVRLHEKDLISKDDVHLSYLPLAHSFERMAVLAALSLGACVGFNSGQIAELLGDMAALRPTFLMGVPRVFQRLVEKKKKERKKERKEFF